MLGRPQGREGPASPEGEARLLLAGLALRWFLASRERPARPQEEGGRDHRTLFGSACEPLGVSARSSREGTICE